MREGAFAEHALEREARSLDDADRRLAHELVYGVVRLRGRLDHVIDCLVVGGLARLDPAVLDVLRLGAYQLLELDRVPGYAVVSEAVHAARRAAGAGAAALTNAVLRRLNREGLAACPFPRRDTDPIGYLTRWGSHPRWLIERWLVRWPLPHVEALIEYNNARPAVYLTVWGGREDAVRRLRAQGISAEAVPRTSASVRVESSQVARALAMLNAVVQDPGAAAVLDYAALAPGTCVVDLCAAPGGKAAVLAGRGHVVWASDISPLRLRRLRETRDRLRLSRLHLAVADATRPPVAGVSAVLLDVPCSGTGTLSRHPDGRWRLRPADLEHLVAVQRRLLDAGAQALAKGGVLIYATCSLEAEENEEQVEAFLMRHPDFELDPPGPGSLPAELVGADGELRVLPHEHGMDGAYAVRLRRRVA